MMIGILPPNKLGVSIPGIPTRPKQHGRCPAAQEWQSLVSALEAAGVEVLTAEAQGLPDPRDGGGQR